MSEQHKTVSAIGVGLLSSLFLSSTFIINSVLAGSGGHWAWTAALRSLFLIPVLVLVLLATGQWRPFYKALITVPFIFLKWGIAGFGVLYTLLALASLVIPGWLVAATFQLNIVAGMLLAPFIYKDHRAVIPKKALLLSIVIVGGVVVMQLDKISQAGNVGAVLLGFILTAVGAIAWPLGNRKLLAELEEVGIHLNAVQRVLGMTIGCVPLLLLLSGIGFAKTGWPPFLQCQASFYSAVFSGFLGGAGFYKAMQTVKHNPVALSTVEATQVSEIFFTLAGEMILTSAAFPGFYGRIGLIIIVAGMFMHCSTSIRHSKRLGYQ